MSLFCIAHAICLNIDFWLVRFVWSFYVFNCILFHYKMAFHFFFLFFFEMVHIQRSVFKNPGTVLQNGLRFLQLAIFQKNSAVKHVAVFWQRLTHTQCCTLNSFEDTAGLYLIYLKGTNLCWCLISQLSKTVSFLRNLILQLVDSFNFRRNLILQKAISLFFSRNLLDELLYFCILFFFQKYILKRLTR